MIHGLGGQATNWTDLMAELVDEVEGWAPDLPGFGWSPPPPDGDYSVTADAEIVSAMLEQLYAERAEPIHLFGNSMGGAIAVLVAAARPDLVATLTLVSPALPDLRPRRDTMGVPVVAVPGSAASWSLGWRGSPPNVRCRAWSPSTTGTPPPSAPNAVPRQLPRWSGGWLSRTPVRRCPAPLVGLLRAFIDPGPGGLWAAAAASQVPDTGDLRWPRPTR